MKALRQLFWFIVSAIIIALSSCNSSNTQSYEFKSQGIGVTLSCNKDWIITTEDKESSSTMVFWENEDKIDMYGHITFTNTDKQYNNIDEILQDFSANSSESVIAEVNERLRFIEYKGVFPANDAPNYWYMFLYYDSEINTTAFGRFSYNNNEKEIVLNLAKSISLKEIEIVSPYPDDYTLIEPTITIKSSGEKVTDYCVVAKRWKNFDPDMISPEIALKDKSAYVLSENDNIEYNSEEYVASTFTANLRYGTQQEALFLEGRGFRIRKWDENITSEFYVCITAEFGISGEIQYVFKCRYE